MAAELLTGLGIFKSMFDAAKGLKDINDTTIRNGAVVELQEKILAAQAQQAALVDRIRDLEKEVASFDAWEREKSRYQLTKGRSGMFCYVLKQEACGSEPPHRICANCYQKNTKSLLHQWRTYDSGNVEYRCMGCKMSITHDP